MITNSTRLICQLVTLVCFTMPSVGQSRPFEVRDSTELTIFNDPSQFAPAAEVKKSHDGKFALIVTSKGLTESDEISSTLWLYDLTKLRATLMRGGRPPTALRKKLFTTTVVPSSPNGSSYASMILDARWSSTTDHIYFRAQNRFANNQLYIFDVSARKLHALTPPNRDVLSFDLGKDETILCRISAQKSHDGAKPPGDEVNADAWAVTGINLETILFPDAEENELRPRETELWTIKAGPSGYRSSSLRDGHEYDLNVIDVLSISPDSRWAVCLRPVTSVPDAWTRFKPSQEYPYMSIDPSDPTITSPFDDFRLKEYELIDLRHGGMAKLVIPAPQADPLGYGPRNGAIWSQDGRRLLVLNTFMPSPGNIDNLNRSADEPCAVMAIDLRSTIFQCILHETDDPNGIIARVERVSFGATSDRVRVLFRSHKWMDLSFHGTESGVAGTAGGSDDVENGLASRTSSENTTGLKLTIRQDWNTPPTFWASDALAGREELLWDPNPQLRSLKLAWAERLRWTGKDGREWQGMLVKPLGFSPGVRYPLVIQTHGYRDNQFMTATDGAFPTAMAARAMASSGIMVLQLPSQHDGEGSPREASVNIDGFRSAILQLDKMGMVDPARVGIVGFSRTCWYVESALIRYPKLFTAAVIADGIDQSYIQYHLMSENPVHAAATIPMYHAKPLGEGLHAWMNLAPGFHLDEVIAPVRIEGIGPMSTLLEWELYSSLREQRKPVDLEYIPKGNHILQRPLQRLASQQGTVDWFRFWLQDYIDPDSAKATQYERWRKLRDLRRAPSTSRMGAPGN